MDKDKYLGIFGLLALLAFLSFLAFLVWQTRQQTLSMVTPDEIQRAREIARRLS